MDRNYKVPMPRPITEVTKEATFIKYFEELQKYYLNLRAHAQAEGKEVIMLVHGQNSLEITVSSISRNDSYGMVVRGVDSKRNEVHLFAHYTQIQVVFKVLSSQVSKEARQVDFN